MDSDAFGVGLEPFGISPDPRFMYFDPRLHREHQILLNGLRCGIGIAVVTGERGVGKTTLFHCLAAELDFADHLVVYVSCLGSPSLGDIMAAFGFRIGFPGQPKARRGVNSRTSLSDMLGFLGVCGTSAILLLDDADCLNAETLSGLLSMSNNGSDNGATVSIVLAGSLDLARRLDRISDPSSDKKVDLIVPLSPLKREDVESYISHRLQVTGHGEAPVFELEAIDRIAHYAHGNPQAINRICRAAMVIAARQSQATVSKRMVEQVTWSARDGPREGGTPHFESADPAMAPATSEKPVTGSRDDGDLDGAHDGTKPALEAAMPSGREPNARPSLEMPDIRRARPRAPGRRRWVSLGAVSAIGAVVLYLLAGGEATDGTSVTADLATSIDAQHGKEDPSRTTFAASSGSEQGEPSELEKGRPQPFERQEAIPREASGSDLEQALYLGDVRAVQALLDAGADINAPISDGRTLLTVAADSGDKAMVMALIDRGADLSVGTAGAMAFHADLRPSDVETGVESASFTTANRETEYETIKAGWTDPGVTPLIAAARAGHAYVVDVLLAAGADVDAADSRGRTSLIAAVDSGDRLSVGLLLARGANIRAVDDTGRSALDIAREKSRWDLVDMISSRAKPLPVENKPLIVKTTALQLSTASQQVLTHVGDTNAEESAAVIQRQPGPSRVQRQSAPGAVIHRARVLQTQHYLRRLGYDPGPVDGVRGAKTRSAVRKFQSDQGIKVDGRISAGLLKSLAAEAGTQETKQLTAEAKATPGIRNFLVSMLGELQNLRGLEFNSKNNPKEIYTYCRKNRDNWIYDEGIEEAIFCKNYVKSNTL